jgi:hypothetical protein
MYLKQCPIADWHRAARWGRRNGIAGRTERTNPASQNSSMNKQLQTVAIQVVLKNI